MEHHNDKTIFKCLNPQNNEILSKLDDGDIREILYYLDRYYLEYRWILGVDSDITFGIEIEIDNFKGSSMDHWPFELRLNELLENNRWKVKNDITLKWGREIASDVLRDSNKTWEDIKKVCDFASQYGEIERTCAAHVHVGSQILGDNLVYWYRLFKLWSIYENVIYRFCYGEYLTHRDGIVDNAKPAAMFFEERLPIVEKSLNSCNLLKMLYLIKPKDMSIDMLKKYGISYWHMLADDEYNIFEDFNIYNYGCTVEYRAGNGTMNEIIWQNEILFFIKLMLYCKSDKFDEDIVNRRKLKVEGLFSNIWDYSKVYLEQALELCDMIYDNNIDKIYFLRQYLKSFEIADKTFVKARKFTM